MKFLLDTHVLFWSIIEDDLLSEAARVALTKPENEIFVSVATAWEMAIKVGLKKWPEAANLIDNFSTELGVAGFRVLPISVLHVRAAGLMPAPHRDPFDRLLAAQARVEGMTIVTADPKVQALGAAWIW